MAELLTEVVVGATGKDLEITLVDERKRVIPITGGRVWLQATSLDLPGVTLDVEGAVVDGPNGLVKWEGIGDPTTYISGAELTATPALFVCRVKYRDAAGKYDWTPEFLIQWVAAPAV
jgi:hypothetical protein